MPEPTQGPTGTVGPTSRPSLGPPTLPPASPVRAGHARLGETDWVGFGFIAPEYLTAYRSSLMLTIAMEQGSVAAPKSSHGHGVVVAVVDFALVHGDPDRIQIRSDPAGFLEDLETLGRASLTEPESVTVGGVNALQVDNDPDESAQASDVHLQNGLAYGFYVSQPSRIIALEAGGHHLAIVIWAANEAVFAAWLPEAEKIVESIVFDE